MAAEHLGRPRGFNVDEVLEKALEVFWEKGYHGASIPDLTKAMGINRSSLYAAFESKDKLFSAALEKYMAHSSARTQAALEQPTAFLYVQYLLNSILDQCLSPENPRGCFIIKAMINQTNHEDPLRKALLAHRQEKEHQAITRFQKAKDEGDLGRHEDPLKLARDLGIVIQGMAVQAMIGTSMEEIRAMVDIALRAFQSPSCQED